MYSRAHLLAVREQLTACSRTDTQQLAAPGPRGGRRADWVPEAIRRNVPSRLTYLIRRKRGMRAGRHSHRPIRVFCSTGPTTDRLDGRFCDLASEFRNERRYELQTSAAAGTRVRCLTCPRRRTVDETLQLQNPVMCPFSTLADACDTPSDPGRQIARPISTVESHRPATYRQNRTTTRDRQLIDVATIQQCRPVSAAQTGGTRAQTAVTSRALLTLELLNIQSMLPKMPDILADIASGCPDVLCYTETNLKVSTPDRFVTIPGYTIHRSDRITGRKKSGEGVAIYVKASLNTDLVMKTSKRTSHVEHIWVKSKLSDRRSVVIGCIYRPPSATASQVNADFDDIEELIQSVISQYPERPVIITGDFNADRSTNPAGAERLERLTNYGLKIMIDVPTFHRGTTQSVLDNILLSDGLANDDRQPAALRAAV